ncbi:MAG: cytochrome c [Gammaproteobacteria bacterium]|nr:cytochrome c [Gammaproteobacteria bacterium]
MMKKLMMPAHPSTSRGGTALSQTRRLAAVLATALLLAGCAVETVEVQNKQAAQQMAHASKAPGSVYIGWRVFQDKCVACHGVDATGTSSAPNLLPRVRTMGSRQFVSLVLKRYDWGLPPEQAQSEGAAREALVDEVLKRKDYMLTMPAWQGEPRVSANIADLYAYLSARAEGTQGPGRPAQ